MKNTIAYFIKIICIFGVTLNLQAQTCDTLVTHMNKKIAVQNFTVSKKEVIVMLCGEQPTSELVIPINQVKGIIQNGIYLPIYEVPLINNDLKKPVLVIVEEKKPPITSLSNGRILIGLTTGTPNMSSLFLDAGLFSSGQSNNSGIQIGNFGSGNTETRIININISPSIGYSPINHFLVGFSVGYDYLTYDENSISTVTLNPFLRGYLPGNRNFLPFAELGYQFISTKGEGEEDPIKSNGYSFKLGSALFFNQQISLDIFGAYQFVWLEKDSASGLLKIKETFGQFGVGIGFSVFLR